MTAIDNATSSIQQVQNDFAILTQYLQACQSGLSNGMPINTTTLKSTIQILATNITTDLQTVKTNVTNAVSSL